MFQPLLQKICRDGAEVTLSGRLFQMREAAVVNALSPTVDSHIGSTISADVDDDLSRCLGLALIRCPTYAI